MQGCNNNLSIIVNDDEDVSTDDEIQSTVTWKRKSKHHTVKSFLGTLHSYIVYFLGDLESQHAGQKCDKFELIILSIHCPGRFETLM